MLGDGVFYVNSVLFLDDQRPQSVAKREYIEYNIDYSAKYGTILEYRISKGQRNELYIYIEMC